MQKFYTYLHCRPDGIPFYVGKGGGKSSGKRSHNFNDRSEYHKKIVKKYGKENIRVYVFPCESEEEALHDEIHQIAQLRQEGYSLCNMTDGGEGLKNPSFETRKRLSDAAKKYWASDEYREKILEKKVGMKLSEEHCEKISLGNTGKKRSKEYCERMSIIRSGEKRSDAAKKKMSESAKRNDKFRKRDEKGRYL